MSTDAKPTDTSLDRLRSLTDALVGGEKVSAVARRRLAWIRHIERRSSSEVSQPVIRFDATRPEGEYARAVAFMRGAPGRAVVVAQASAMRRVVEDGGPPGYAEAHRITRMLLRALDEAATVIAAVEGRSSQEEPSTP